MHLARLRHCRAWKASSFAFFSLLCACPPAKRSRDAASHSTCRPEAKVQLLPLSGPAASTEAEFSGMDWFDDELVLLPQYPARFGAQGDRNGQLFVLRREVLQQAIAGELPSLRPQPLPFVDAALRERIQGFQGYEAIAFQGSKAYLSIETEVDGRTHALLVRGTMQAHPPSLVLEATPLANLRSPRPIANLSYEALVVHEGGVDAFYELNGRGAPAKALRYSEGSAGLSTLPFPTLEYRLTDATTLDAKGCFWVSNYYWPKSAWKPAPCALTKRWGQGCTHAAQPPVERLVELCYGARGALHWGPHAPLLLRLNPPRTDSRNWEGLVRFGDQGFLLITDKHPQTLLAFVAARLPR